MNPVRQLTTHDLALVLHALIRVYLILAGHLHSRERLLLKGIGRAAWTIIRLGPHRAMIRWG